MNRNMGGNRGYSGGDITPPVKVGDELNVKIEAVGEKGDGIAKKDGFVLFVPGVKEGQNVKIKVTKVLRKVGFAEVAGEAEEGAVEEQGQYNEMPEPAAEEPQEEASAEDSDDFGSDDSDEESPESDMPELPEDESEEKKQE